MLCQCLANVCDVGPALKQHCRSGIAVTITNGNNQPYWHCHHHNVILHAPECPATSWSRSAPSLTATVPAYYTQSSGDKMAVALWGILHGQPCLGNDTLPLTAFTTLAIVARLQTTDTCLTLGLSRGMNGVTISWSYSGDYPTRG